MQRDLEGLVEKGTSRRDPSEGREQRGVMGKAFQVEGVTRAKALGSGNHMGQGWWGGVCGGGVRRGLATRDSGVLLSDGAP